MESLPLQGIRILDLSRLLPGPYLTQLLADLGAEVIKVESPLAGDYSRLAPPEMGLGGLFESVNRGKKSLAVNFRNARGRHTEDPAHPRDWDAADKGRRLDHIWATPDISNAGHGSRILRAVRGWEKPSDHAPVFASFDL